MVLKRHHALDVNVDDRALRHLHKAYRHTANQSLDPAGGQVEIAGTIDSGLCGVDEFFLNGAQVNVSQRNFQRFLTFPEGQQNIIYEVSDAAGNRQKAIMRFGSMTQPPP